MSKREWNVDFRQRLAVVVDAQREALAKHNLTAEEFDRAMEPLLSWQARLEEEATR